MCDDLFYHSYVSEMYEPYPDDMYVRPTCDNYTIFHDDGPGIDYDDQVFVLYTFSGERMFMQGWLCEDENCKFANRGRHLVPEIGTGGVLFLDMTICDVTIFTAQEMIKKLEA